MSGLEEVGIPGKEYLREALTNCADPLKAIEDFQTENGILLPSLRPMLPLLDRHGVPRQEFHLSVLEELKDTLIATIEKLSQNDPRERERKLKELLQKSFILINVPKIKPVVLCILKNMDRVEDRYLKHLVSNKQLYQECDVQVKRQIWQDNQSLFGDEVSPLLTQYIKEKEDLLFKHSDPITQFFAPSPKQRRQGEVVQKLLTMIGHNVKLYDMVLQFLRTLFLRTKIVHYCTLRSELLMALHDLEIQEITHVDPCHKFTWCLDACIREKNVDVKRSRELQGFLDSIKRGNEQVLGDLSMTLCDPYAINFLATSALKIIMYLISQEGYARENAVLVLLLRMLALGLQAWEMISTQVYKEPKLDAQLVTKFLPSLMSLMVDDQVRAINAKLPQDDRESAITTIEHFGPPPDAYQAYIQENGVASVLAMYYTLQNARQKDRHGLMRVLGTLALCENDRAFEDPFLNSLTYFLVTNLIDEFSTEDFCTVVFDEFFLTGLAKESVVRHILKLLNYVYTKLPPSRLDGVMKALQPCAQHYESIQPAFQEIQKLLKNHQPVCVPKPMEVDSPLLSVPTPAPV
ncbi:negative elongation factor B-like [Argiope bruennichi]|uniref:Negative elongation factor B like protein n=1 Tax=Argiope bruennichi TaxID=94029 RepID=A0A8T0G1N3_ARGBR|nr:negative elongation factor B-like [Argiope bruennichi]KAF8796796.1 Negative elongation factor B like protein [Argiope bruennichi]